MDEDLAKLSRDELISELVRIRQTIREHRDSTGHNLCWYQPELYELLPEKIPFTPTIPEWPEFMRGCVQYTESLDGELPDAPRTQCAYQKP